MEENFIGYLLDALDEREKRQVELYLAQHPEARDKLVQLKQAIEPLAADADTPAPPSQLVERTLAKVAEHICAPESPPAELPHAPPVSRAALAGGRSWWRRVDVLVAACLLVTVVGVGVTVLARLRGPSSAATQVECKNNQLQYFIGFQMHRDRKGKFPDIAKEEAPFNVAGMFVPILNDAGMLPAATSIRCPGMGAPLASNVSLTDLRKMNAAEFEQQAPCLSLCYAYSLGYRDEAGVYHGPGDHPQSSWSQTPILADRPPAEGVLGNSINHGGTGQNVLFADGHVKFLPQRTYANGDDIYLNRDGKVAAGLDATDIVLGHSSAHPK